MNRCGGSIGGIVVLLICAIVASTVLMTWSWSVVTLKRLLALRRMAITLESAVVRAKTGYRGKYEENGFEVRLTEHGTGVEIWIGNALVSRRYMLNLEAGGQK